MFRMYEWKPNDLANRQDSVFSTVEETEPKVVFRDKNEVDVLTLTSTKLEYNRDAFSTDSYHQAAHRLFSALDDTMLSKSMHQTKQVTIRLKEYKELPQRIFGVHTDGTIEHNYNLDLWHWWLLETFSDLVRKKYNI